MNDVTTAADASSVRHWNERAVIEALSGGENLRVAQIAAATGLTTASAGDVLRGLEAKGWVRQISPERTGMGRPARSYQLVDLPATVLGVDVGGHTVRAVLLHPGGHIEPVGRVAIPDGAGLDATLDAVRQVIDGVDLGQVWMTGVALSGAIDATGTITRSVALPSLEGLDATRLFAEVIGGPLKICHDVRAALWAETSAAGWRPRGNVMLVHLGRRPSIALQLNGSDYVGTHGTAGDLSLSDLIQPWEAYLPDVASGGGDPVGAVLAAAGRGEPTAVAGARDFFERITPQLAFAVALVDPEVVVLSGALAPAIRDVTSDFVSLLERRVEQVPEVLVSNLDEFAVASGAAHLVRHRVRKALLERPGGVAQLEQESLAKN